MHSMPALEIVRKPKEHTEARNIDSLVKRRAFKHLFFPINLSPDCGDEAAKSGQLFCKSHQHHRRLLAVL